MSIRSRNALIEAIVWLVTMVGFTLMFFQGSDSLQWGRVPIFRGISALLVVISFGITLGLQIRTKKTEPLDERTSLVQLRSLSLTISAILIYVFLLSVTLFVVYEEAQLIPVGWFWFIAYTTIIMTFLFANLLYVIMESRDVDYGIN